MTVTIENAIPDPLLSIDELTEASLDGNGVLDVLLRTMRIHLEREFRDGRITGVAYATAYTESLGIFLPQAIQYALAKSKLSLELQQLQAQVELLQVQKEQVLAESNKIATDTVVAIKQGHLVDAQTCDVQARTNQVNAEVGLRLPVEIDNLKKQGVLVATQTSELTYRIQHTLPAEVEQIYAQTHQTLYSTENILPAEKTKLLAEIDLVVSQDDLAEFTVQYKAPIEKQILEKQRDQLKAQTAQIVSETNKIAADTITSLRQAKLVEANTCNTEAQTTRITSETTLKLPEEVNLLKKQTIQVDAQTDKVIKDTELGVIQLDLATKELLVKEKSIDLLIAQAAGQVSQNRLYDQKTVTEKAQTDSTVIGTDSVVYRQNEMMKAQADGFKRDAEQKAAKIMIDTWSLRKNSDPDETQATAVNRLLDNNIGLSVQKLLAGVDISV